MKKTFLFLLFVFFSISAQEKFRYINEKNDTSYVIMKLIDSTVIVNDYHFVYGKGREDRHIDSLYIGEDFVFRYMNNNTAKWIYECGGLIFHAEDILFMQGNFIADPSDEEQKTYSEFLYFPELPSGYEDHNLLYHLTITKIKPDECRKYNPESMYGLMFSYSEGELIYYIIKLYDKERYLIEIGLDTSDWSDEFIFYKIYPGDYAKLKQTNYNYLNRYF